MKLGPSENFYCRTWLCQQEALEFHPNPQLFSEMFLLGLQGGITNIAFVPFIDRNNNPLPPILKAHEELTTQLEARLYIVDTSNYTVTPDDSRVGMIETYETQFEDFIWSRKIFYISERDYCKYVYQVMRIYHMSYNPAGIKVAEIKSQAFVDFLKKTIIPNMEESHRKYLQPKR